MVVGLWHRKGEISGSFTAALLLFTSNVKSLQKIEKLQQRALRFLYNDHKRSYNDLLLKSGRCTMQVSCQRAFCIEIYKTMNNSNPPFMKNFFVCRSSHYSSRTPYDLQHIRPNQATFGSNSLESVGPQIWMVYQTK